MVLATIGLLARAEPYLSHHRMFSHDNLPLISYLKLSYGNIMAGRLPLWTPELNAGQPLWPVAEVAVGLDPVAGLAWLVAMVGGGLTIDVLHWTCFGWLLAFATGAIALSRRLTDDPWILTGIYGYIVLGPIWLAMPAQSYGFLLPFRYLPWVLLLLIQLIEHPTRLGGVGLGIVAGLSLAGYQALYALPVVVVFAAAYVLVRVRQGLRLQRAHIWAALSVLLGFLPVALPTAVALLYASTDLYVVARTHFQGRYAFSASALLLDLMGPLTPSPQSWHGAFSLGPGLLFFSLLGIGALLLQAGYSRTRGPLSREPDQIPREGRILGHERTALSVAWLATTGTAIILATGPATDRFLLGLRNWGFVLTVSLLGATQLTIAAAEFSRGWLQVPGASTRRPLALAAALIGLTGVIVLGFYVVLWTNPDVARECMVRLLCDRLGGLTRGYLTGMTLGLAPLLTVLLLSTLLPPTGFAGRGWGHLFGVAFLGMMAWHLVVTLHGGPLGGQALAIPTAGRTPPSAPDLEMVAPTFPGVRERLFDIRPFVPFHYEGPSVWHRAAARTLPVAFAYAPLSQPVTPITHVFRFWRYQALVSAGLAPTIEDRVLAVTASPLHLATRVFEARDLEEALGLLARGDTTEPSAVVVEAAGQGLQGLVRFVPSETADDSGSIRVERFSADSIRLRVRTPHPALLVYADGYDPEWSAFVGGRSVPVYPANVIGKAVPVPAGDSVVDLVYRPWPYIIAFWLRALALLGACGAVLGLLVCRFGFRGGGLRSAAAQLAGVAAPLLAAVVGAPPATLPHLRSGFAELCLEAPARLVVGNLAGLVLLRVSSLVLRRRFTSLAALPVREREICLHRLAGARWYVVRALFFAVKATALLLLSRRPRPSASGGAARSDLAGKHADYVIVGSGAAGATVALDLARAGRDVLVVEEGPWLTTPDFPSDLYSALRDLWRDFGTQLATGRSVIPVLQGRCVGGSTVINGAIVHRLPRHVWGKWGDRDPKLVDALPWSDIEEAAESLERDLQVVAKLAARIEQLPMHQALQRLGWQHSAMVRNAPGCMHSGHCLLGCPTGGKWSMDRSFIPTARELGARIRPNVRITRVLFEGRRAIGVEAAGGETILARRAVVIAAGVVHTPLLLRASGVRHPDLGAHFQCHLSSAVVGRYAGAAAAVEGLPMGLEVLHFPDVKLATQSVPPEMLTLRLPVQGDSLRELLAHADRLGAWTVTVRSEAEGTVGGSLKHPRIRFSPRLEDMSRIRFGAARIVELLFAAGAEIVYPQIVGLPEVLREKEQAGLVERGPTDPRCYSLATSHLFGTCRIGADPLQSLVSLDFRVHGRDAIYVADASLFPTATGVNPQHAIMALARLAARRVVEA